MGADNTLRIGIIGDFEPTRRSHIATNAALRHAAKHLALDVAVCWLPTLSLAESTERQLEACDGLWASPGSPYRSLEGSLRAIRFARQRNWPFVGT
jgi:CTP synthase (UTP-ammonia lyase)